MKNLLGLLMLISLVDAVYYPTLTGQKYPNSMVFCSTETPNCIDKYGNPANFHYQVETVNPDVVRNTQIVNNVKKYGPLALIPIVILGIPLLLIKKYFGGNDI